MKETITNDSYINERQLAWLYMNKTNIIDIPIENMQQEISKPDFKIDFESYNKTVNKDLKTILKRFGLANADVFKKKGTARNAEKLILRKDAENICELILRSKKGMMNKIISIRALEYSSYLDYYKKLRYDKKEEYVENFRFAVEVLLDAIANSFSDNIPYGEELCVSLKRHTQYDSIITIHTLQKIIESECELPYSAKINTHGYRVFINYLDDLRTTYMYKTALCQVNNKFEGKDDALSENDNCINAQDFFYKQAINDLLSKIEAIDIEAYTRFSSEIENSVHDKPSKAIYDRICKAFFKAFNQLDEFNQNLIVETQLFNSYLHKD